MSDASGNRAFDDPRPSEIGTAAALFERSPHPMVAVAGTDSPRVEVVNAAYLDCFDGRSTDPGQCDPVPRRSELSGAERSAVRVAARGDVATDTVTKRTAGGQRCFAVRAIPAETSDLTAFLRYRDVTERTIRDQQLTVLRRVLRHDLRNDLTVILGYAQTIAASSDDPAAREAAETMISAASDLREVAGSAGRMECVTAAVSTSELADLVARSRRELDVEFSAGVRVEGALPSTQIDDRIGIALEELAETLARHGDATWLSIRASAVSDGVELQLETDGQLSEQQRGALHGRCETKLRHASGIAPWLARWAIRAAGGRLRIQEHEEGLRLTITTPTAPEAAVRPPVHADDS